MSAWHLCMQYHVELVCVIFFPGSPLNEFWWPIKGLSCSCDQLRSLNLPAVLANHPTPRLDLAAAVHVCSCPHVAGSFPVGASGGGFGGCYQCGSLNQSIALACPPCLGSCGHGQQLQGPDLGSGCRVHYSSGQVHASASVLVAASAQRERDGTPSTLEVAPGCLALRRCQSCCLPTGRNHSFGCLSTGWIQSDGGLNIALRLYFAHPWCKDTKLALKANLGTES